MSFWRTFGPGVLFAGSAIGTSHLVQSTRAGAVYGLGLLVIVLLANFLKYPAYRFGPMYAAATGRSLVDGYRELGRSVVAVFVLAEVVVSSIIIAATGLVTAAILLALTSSDFSAQHLGIALILAGMAVLIVGGYPLLDKMTKVFVGILTIATLAATAMTLGRIDWSSELFAFPSLDGPTFVFVIALMGFMPAAMDLSVLQSLWCVAKRQTMTEPPAERQVLADFNFGYVATMILAICFLLMGAGVMHSGGIEPATQAAPFARQVMTLYTANLGDWAGSLVGVAAFFVMFTTLITIIDGMPRIVAAGVRSLRDSGQSESDTALDKTREFRVAMLILNSLAILILLYQTNNFQRFIDLVTITAFVVAPFIAFLNHLVMTSARVPENARPGRALTIWSVFGVVLLSLLSLIFLYVRFA